MTNENAEFDVLLGGTEELPSTLNIAKFIASRSQEIQVMKNSLAAQCGAKLAFQTLPKHMRRRAMSHNVKRLPRRLRQIHLNQMKKSGMPTKQKRPSRKYRRRPRNLIEEYTKRSCKKYKWLQTHIWHAKRFHMVEKWGYKLACHPCDKAFKACYRAISQHCLVQDISYLNCMEISGDKSLIIARLKQLCKSNEGLSFGAKSFVSGNREGELILYDNKLCQRPIGNINFHWQPIQGGDISKLWLWIHPAFYCSVKNTLIETFCLSTVDVGNISYQNSSTRIKLLELGNKLSRFRLTGPLATSILQDLFETVDSDKLDLQQILLREYINNNKKLMKSQYDCWEKLKYVSSAAEVAPHMILSLLVKDPRLKLPEKRVKVVSDIRPCIGYSLDNNISQSPLWEEKLQEEITQNKMTDSEIANLQSTLLVPGSHLKEVGAIIPVILIQRPGNKQENIGLGSGWDVILPSVWAKPFWIGMIMRGARVGGLRESKSLLFEMGRSQYLRPDTISGSEEEEQISRKWKEIYFKKPPNKRTNYNKFNIVTPFCLHWRLLINDWNQDPKPLEEFTVLRDKRILNSLNNLLNSKTKLIPDYPNNCLIPVKLTCENRGSPAQFAIICLAKYKNDFKGNVMEPICIDKYQAARKELRQTHQSLLKKLRKQRKAKKEITNHSEVHQEILCNYKKKIRALWLPEATAVRNSCSREVIGFVKKGGFSFSRGKSFGTGYITSNALPSLLKSHCRNKVLFRNTNTRQYRVAKLSIILE